MHTLATARRGGHPREKGVFFHLACEYSPTDLGDAHMSLGGCIEWEGMRVTPFIIWAGICLQKPPCFSSLQLPFLCRPILLGIFPKHNPCQHSPFTDQQLAWSFSKAAAGAYPPKLDVSPVQYPWHNRLLQRKFKNSMPLKPGLPLM